MNRSLHDQRPLFEPWFAWQELPNDVRQQALDMLAAICFEIVDSQILETENDDPSEC